MTCRRNERVMVALSGGVDSAVAAALLVDAGHEVEGVYVKTWEHETDVLGDCPGAQDLADAQDVAECLGIPFEVVNFVDFYQENVVRPMVEGYRNGITPNPDVTCNRRMKFGKLLEHAEERGFEALATGHYCRRELAEDGTPQLWEGLDKNKDQSYFLARILPKQLAAARFPLGEIPKPEVRRIAKERNIPVADKKDSQGICFLGKVKVSEFLEGFLDDEPGVIVTCEGKVVGEHRGLHRYTLGQRKGIGVPSNTDNENFVVVGKDLDAKRLIVAFEGPDAPGLWGQSFLVDDLSYVGENITGSQRLLAKPRFRDPSTPIDFHPLDNGSVEVTFESPQRALAPGQVIAIYEGERLLGGGFYRPSLPGRADLPPEKVVSA
ncbi:MAG: tRNA 2-thiouridine(34) synthase MnmA [Opitutales bacterium]